MKNLVIVLSIALSVSVLGCKQSAAQQSKLLEPQELEDVLASKQAHFVDVRTPKEFNAGHIENAVNIDFKSPNFETEIKKLDSSKPIVVYCRSGRRSRISTNTLVKVGFTEIYDLNGGILNWLKQGKELVKE